VSELGKGEVRLYERWEPKLLADRYRMDIDQSVTDGGEPLFAAAQQSFHFDVTAPRLALQPADVIGVFPAAGEREASSLRLPHIALRRRTLPWERRVAPGSDATAKQTPWFALLLFEAKEVTLQRGASPQGLGLVGLDPAARCDLVRARQSLLKKVLPLQGELPLLAHVREVSRKDQEIGDDDDGFLSVVVGNRLPTPGVEHVACLVSLEGRWDAPFWPTYADTQSDGSGGSGTVEIPHIPWDEIYEVGPFVPGGPGGPGGPWPGPGPEPGPVFEGGPGVRPDLLAGRAGAPGVLLSLPAGATLRGPGGVALRGPLSVLAQPRSAAAAARATGAERLRALAVARDETRAAAAALGAFRPGRPELSLADVPGLADLVVDWNDPFHQLVVLYSWTFTAGTGGDFEMRMQTLHRKGGVGRIGEGAPGQPPVADAGGHVRLDHRSRGGEPGQSRYRGPLAPVPVTPVRPDGLPLVADAALALGPEGLDVSYAAAFELGRLLAMADPEVMAGLLDHRRNQLQARARFELRGLLPAPLRPVLPEIMKDLPHMVDVLTDPRGPLVNPGPLVDGRLGDPSGLVDLLGAVPGLTEATVTALKGGEAGALLAQPGLSPDGLLDLGPALGLDDVAVVPDLGDADLASRLDAALGGLVSAVEAELGR
jgi:hypothetical protein